MLASIPVFGRDITICTPKCCVVFIQPGRQQQHQARVNLSQSSGTLDCKYAIYNDAGLSKALVRSNTIRIFVSDAHLHFISRFAMARSINLTF